MPNEVITIGGQIAVLAVLGLAGAAFRRQDFHLRWFVAALLLYVVYDVLLTRGMYQIPNWPPGANWNWLGKILSTSGTLLLAALPAFGYARAGIRLRQNKGLLVPLVVLALFAALFIYLALADGAGRSDAETIAFEWTMPGLDEELFYRGLLLLAMNEAFRARWTVWSAPVGYGGLLTSVLFGLAHAMSFGQGGFDFDLMTFAVTGVPSLFLLWLRERTGSVLLPILAHNMANGISTLF
ncbi:MAG: CPBP family intramembrane metalloprotease [Alphaproteobacteria bacterium]|nr:MAG: CPBP family intramembrane metalloprotease [Alphaproteobacteria bacterium]